MSKNFFHRFFGGGSSEPEPEHESPETSFRGRVTNFWRWFAAHETELFTALGDQSLDPQEASQAVEQLHEDIAWEFCPTAEEGKEGFTLSGAGSTTLRLLVNHAIAQAPPLLHWKLFSSKQASDGLMVVKMDEDELDFADFCFALDFDKDHERLHVSVSHPEFTHLPKDARQQLMMIALDNALGENFVEAWIGTIDDTPERTPEQTFTWDKIKGQARAAITVHDLDPDLDPIERWYSYSNSEPGDGDVIARADIFAGSTCHVALFQSFFDPKREDELAGCGAVFVYLMIPMDCFSSGKEASQRGQIEDSLSKVLEASGSGSLVGGATGVQYAYIDMILFDEDLAVETLRKALQGQKRVKAANLRYFPVAREDERVVLK